MAVKETVRVDIYKYAKQGSVETLLSSQDVTMAQLKSLLRAADYLIRYNEDGTVANKYNVLDHFVSGGELEGPVHYLSITDAGKYNIQIDGTYIPGYNELGIEIGKVASIVDMNNDPITVMGPFSMTDTWSSTKSHLNRLNVTEFGEYSASKLESSELATVDISEISTIKRIHDRAFYKCPETMSASGESATAYTFSSDLVSIGKEAFVGCRFNQNTLTIPAGVDTIGVDAFKDTTGITTVNIYAAEGEIANAPWGFPDTVTINYDYTE